MKKQPLNAAQIRQGDVLIEMIDDLPGVMAILPPDADGSATLAHGEVTGHRHRFAPQFDGDGESMLYAHPRAPTEPARIKLDTPRALIHEEHGAPVVPAGVGRISRPYEYQGAELIRRVED